MSAESLLSTRTLVLGMVDDAGHLDAGLLYDVAGTCGMTDQQVRLCLRRLVVEGTLQLVGGRGRRATFTATSGDAVGILPELEYLEHAYRQDAGLAPWDDMWHLAAFSVPESRRHARDELRRTLRFLGGATTGGGLYVCANNWDETVVREATRLGVDDGLTVATTRDLRVGDADDPRAIAARLWDLPDLASAWSAFEATLAARRSNGGDVRERVGAAFASAVEFSVIMERDPLLPAELLPPNWPGRSARALMAAAGLEVDGGEGPLVAALRRLSVRVGALPDVG
jgi:phenylacetic acid degradation operon negative regulatory protein